MQDEIIFLLGDNAPGLIYGYVPPHMCSVSQPGRVSDRGSCLSGVVRVHGTVLWKATEESWLSSAVCL